MYKVTREYTNKLLEAIDNDILSKDIVIMACLKYMSESDVKDMCEANLFFEYEDEEENELA